MSPDVCVCAFVSVCISSCSTGVTVALQLLRSVAEIVGPHTAEEGLDEVCRLLCTIATLLCFTNMHGTQKV